MKNIYLHKKLNKFQVGYIETQAQIHHSQTIQKAKNLESCKRRFVIYKRSSIRLTADFSSETMEVRRQWNNIIKVLKSILNSVFFSSFSSGSSSSVLKHLCDLWQFTRPPWAFVCLSLKWKFGLDGLKDSFIYITGL